jgi:hypothetical protein
MKNIILLVLLSVPCVAFASNCSIVDYPDHYEAICVGDTESTPVLSVATESPQLEWVQVVSSAQIAQLSDDSALPDIAPENIVRNDLARLHGDYWLKAQGR